MQIQNFGTTKEGQDVSLITLENKNGMRLSVTDYGAAIVSLIVPDKNEQPVDVVLGYPDVSAYEPDTYAFGATIGRVGNRIAGAAFTLDGKNYTLDANDGRQCLHGGFHGYHKRIWSYEVSEADCAVSFSLHSPDMDQGFPGTLDITVTYSLDEKNGLHIRYFALPDAPTLINMTNHTYFNLNGHDSGSDLDHEVTIHAGCFTESNDEVYPNGNILTVNQTPLDFTTPHTIGERIESDHQQIQFGGGYDHNYVLDNFDGDLRTVAHVYAPKTGITMTMDTDTPGMQFYTGNFINNGTPGKNGAVYNRRDGFCFESQDYPDAIHYTHFPSIIYEAGEPYVTETVYTFGTKDSAEA